jgi:hypothetical protein
MIFLILNIINYQNKVGISLDETVKYEDINDLLEVFDSKETFVIIN